MASSSKTASPSSSARQWKYDVFLSFRGPDTRKSITSEIYGRLQNRRGIKTFLDDQDLEVGDAISPSLLTAIEESRFAIVILSPNYAFSTWCLEELTKICQCMEDNRILPLFYNVNPTDVRYQKMTFKDAFTKHEISARYESNKLQQWRDALNKVASTFSVWHTDKFKTDRELADDIVDFVCTKVLPTAIESTGDFTIFEATRQAIDQLMRALKDNNVTAAGVYGMGGVGKTTLVEHVGQEARKQGLFDHVIMVRVNQTPDLKRIQAILADGLGIKLMNETDEGRASRLSSEIMRRNKILIILDNVWGRLDLPSIGIPSHNMLQSCNSKVLLTTRIWNVCHVMMSQENITLSTLSKEDSWTLFVKYARKSFESTYFKDVARKVARECGGLPIALIAVAMALGDKDLTEWKYAAQLLEKSRAANPDDNGEASKCIKLSYDFLKDEDSKSCFLLCCLFPEDYDIRIEDLFKYGIGIGLFQDTDTIQEARGKARSVAKHLTHSSLLLDRGIDGCVTMHDVIRDTAIQIARSEDEHGFFVEAGCGLKNWPRRLREGHSAISVMTNDIRELPEELVCPKLQILLLQENYFLDQIPDTCFKNTSLLRVVDLSYTSISSLSMSFIHLSNLQGLYLDSCQNISDISILKNFKKLEILSMKKYPLKELSTEIRNLTNLRVLDVSSQGSVRGGIVRIPSGVISKLRKLEELCLQCGFWDWGSQVEGEGETTNVSFDEVTSLSYLNSLKVCISDVNCIPRRVWVNLSWNDFDICIGRDRNTRNIIRNQHSQLWRDGHKYSRSLVLDTTICMLPAWFVSVVTENTERLMYVNFTGLNNILVEYHHGMLHSLKHLSVIGPNESLVTLIILEAIPSMRNKPVFEKLEELHLESMGSLKELCSSELPSRSLWNLKVLQVRDCPKLGNVLLPSKLLQRLANLENLFCKRVPEMEYVFGCEGFELEQSKLRKMNLFELEAVKSICNGPAPPAMFQALHSLSIYRCKFHGCLFTFNVAQCLFQVEIISVQSCPILERVIEASKESELSKKTVLPKLKYLGLVDLPMLYSGSAAIDMECPSLEHLYVEDCPHVPASAYDFGSNNQVILNDPRHYASQQATKFGTPLSAWDTLIKSRLKVGEKILTSMEPEMMQRAVEFTGKMSQIIQTKPEFAKKFLPSSLAKPELLEMMPRLMELLNGSLTEKNPESMENLIALANITPDLMNHIPAEISKMMDLMTKLMEDTNFIKSLTGIVENIPGIMNLPRIIEDFPRLFEILPMTGSVENMPGIMEDFAQLIENSPQMAESLKDFAQSVENFLNLPQMTEWMGIMENLSQMTE
ncbi:probable disease resistance protein At4g27220 [Rosa chinensis]|nr:probable disease resistance protein At4g27220 [Rosa chinensis]